MDKRMSRKQFLQYCLIVIFLMSGIFIISAQFICYLLLYNNNRNLYRKVNWYLIRLMHTHTLTVTQWYTDSKLIVYTDKENFDKYFGKEHALLILNHTYNNDFVAILMFLNTFGLLGNFRSIGKQAIQWIPIIGPFMKLSENIFVKRNFKEDEQTISKQIKNLITGPYPLLIIFNPEGTRFNSIKHEASMKFAAERNLTPLKYHLVPRTKGFVCFLKAMEGHLPAIYNMQLAFNKIDEESEGVNAMLQSKSVTAHLYIERIPIEKVPKSEDEQNTFLQELFVKKDKIMESFLTTQDFFRTSGVERLDKFELENKGFWYFIPFFFNAVVWAPLFYYCMNSLLYFDMTFLGIAACLAGITYITMSKISAASNKASSYGLN